MPDLISPLLIAVAALGLGALCLPIALSLQFRREERPATSKLLVKMAFFRGGLGLGIHLDDQRRFLMPVLFGKTIDFPSLSLKTGPGEKKKTKKREPAPPSATKTKEETKKRNLLDLCRLLLKPGLKLVRSLPQTIRLKRLQISGSLGFDDPAQTGTIGAYLQAVKYIKNNKIKIDIQPDFTHPGASGQLDLVAHFHLGRLFLLIGHFGLRVACRFLALRLFGRQPSLI